MKERDSEIRTEIIDIPAQVHSEERKAGNRTKITALGWIEEGKKEKRDLAFRRVDPAGRGLTLNNELTEETCRSTVLLLPDFTL
jgi:hypothetical protein